MTHQTDILIIGGGIAGLALAAVLGRAGISVRIVDPKPPQALKKTRGTGRTVALMQSSVALIKKTGIWEKVMPYAAPLKTMRLIDISVPGLDPVQSDFEAHDLGLEQYGYNIPNTLLRAALYERVQALETVTMHTDTLKMYETENARVSTVLESGEKLAAFLLVGADGRNSKVREISGIKCRTRSYGQTAMTCVINHSYAHNDTSTEFHKPGGPLAFVPLPGNQSSVVWVEETEKAEALMRLNKKEFEKALDEAGQNILGALTLDTELESWPLSMLQAEELIAPRTALAAEAAHVLSPITAQGLNLSLRDVGALADIIIHGMLSGIDPGSKILLESYARCRMTDIKTRVLGVDGMNRIVSTNMGALKNIRRLGLKAVERVMPLKRFAMRHGLAPKMHTVG